LDAGRLNFDNLPPIGVVSEEPVEQALPIGPGVPLVSVEAMTPEPQTEERTRVFSKQDMPDVGLPAAGHSTLEASQPMRAPSMSQNGPAPISVEAASVKTSALPAPGSESIMEKTSAVPASLLAKAMPQSVSGAPSKATPQAIGMPATQEPMEAKSPLRQTPRIPEVGPTEPTPKQIRPKPRNSAPNLAPKQPIRSAKPGGKKRKLKTTSARKKRSGGFASKILSGRGITALILSVLLIYGAMAFLPTLFSAPPPQEAVLVLKSVPADAKIIHNGQDTGLTTQAELTGLTVGTSHEIRLELPGYDPMVQTVKIPVEGNTDGVRRVPKTLFLVKAKGTLKVISDPPKAEVYMDGRYLGNTPMEKSGVSREKREFKLTVRLTGYYEKTLTITWGSKTKLERTVKLKKRSR